jgi:hypothetical protein
VPEHQNPALASRVSAEDDVTDLVTECNRRGQAQSLPSGLTHLDDDRQEGSMLVTQATGQEVDNARVAFALVAVGIVVFWRVAIRLLLIAVIVAAGIGALVLLQTVHG